MLSIEVEDPNDPTKKVRKWKKLLPYKMVRVERLLDNHHGRSACVLTFDRERDGEVSVEFDNSDFAESKSFFKKLNGAGLYTDRKSGIAFVDVFMTEFLTNLQRARAANQIASRCGWTDDLQSFVLGNNIYRNDGSREFVRSSGVTDEIEGYRSSGDEAKWREAFDITLAGGPDRQALLALAIASPLMVFTGLDGVLINAYSPESGVGKSTLCDAALSIWGSPNALRKDFRDTSNATFKLASIMGNMPMVIDEFTNIEGKALSDFVYTLTQGREKHRLTSDARMASNSQRWCLAAIATSNNSVHEKLLAYRQDATAEAARVFEMRLHPLQVNPNEMGELKVKLQALRSDYGFLGPKLVEVFLSRPAEYWRKAVMSSIARWDAKDVARGTGDRFRSAACALVEVGAAVGAGFGFNFDQAAISKVMESYWSKQVSEFESERKTPRDMVISYVINNLAEFAVFGGQNGTVLVNVSMPRRFAGEIRGKTTGAYTAESVMIPLDMLRRHVREQHGNFKAVTEWIAQSTDVIQRGVLPFLLGTTNAMHIEAVQFNYSSLLGGTIDPAKLKQDTP